MWTEESYLIFQNKKKLEREIKDGITGKIEKLFVLDNITKEYKFNTENWNGEDLIRAYVMGVYLDDKKVKSDLLHVNCCINDDDWIGYIIVNKENSFDLYTISWYKNRGKTDLITKNNALITLKEYVELLNVLNIKAEI